MRGSSGSGGDDSRIGFDLGLDPFASCNIYEA